VSSPQIVSQFIHSTAPNIPGRNIRIYLPRGYAQNGSKRYPVLYLHDGQNVFDPGGSFGSWSADATATKEMARGRMREAILVAIDNTDARIPEYQPPTDSRDGTQGRADAYASFVINNVRPYVDTHFRTLNDPENTLTLGSSMGGLVSLYLGREFTTFGKIGVISPALWTSPFYVAHVNNTPRKPLRVYIDYGTAESTSSDSWNRALSMYDTHLAQGYAANRDVTFVGGCGHGHDEPAWKARLPGILHYLLPEREEPALLAMRDHRPAVLETAVNRSANRASFIYTSQFGLVYTLERSPDFVTWSPVVTAPRETLPWSRRTIEDAAVPAGDKFFWRVRAAAP
jgi:predicted alpha/beta superfamily hydrolase